MMKRFKAIGKWTGLMLVACTLLFAGCAPDSSSEEGALSGDDASSVGIPATLPIDALTDGDTSNDELDFGDGSAAGIGVFNGHTVEVANGTTGCTNETNPTCWIRTTNRADSHYMANTRVYTNQCSDGAAQFDNADYSPGSTTSMHTSSNMDGDTGYAASVEGGGFCVTEDGKFGTGYEDPFNLDGCHVRGMPAGVHQPIQMLEPDCGAQSVEWNFGSHSGSNYDFYVQVDTEWFPENPHNDARYDFADRTTMYLMMTDLADTMTATYKEWYRLGSYKRSNVIAGWNANGNGNSADSGVALMGNTSEPNDKYFALNVAVEYPDRIETRTVGDKSDFTHYEYYTKFSIVTTYNTNAVERVTTTGYTKPAKQGGIYVVAGALEICSSGNCGVGLETYRGFDSPADPNTNFNDTAGYILTYETGAPGFAWLSPGQNYTTVNGKWVYDYYGGNIPYRAGHTGIAYINMTPDHGYTTGDWNYAIFNSDTAVKQEGVDSEPDMPIAMYNFKLKEAAGEGTWFRSNMNSPNSQHELNYTNTTDLTNSGKGQGTDWNSYCWPMDGTLDGSSMGCSAGTVPSDYIVGDGSEQPNPSITHAGPGTTKTGYTQAWNVHLCVQ